MDAGAPYDYDLSKDDPNRKKQKWEKFLEKQNETVAEMKSKKEAPANGAKEELLMDFTSTFKQSTKAGKSLQLRKSQKKKKQ